MYAFCFPFLSCILSNTFVFNTIQIDQLTKQEIADFKKAFSLLDKDHDGVINVKDLGIVMKSLGMNPTDTELKEILSDADTENGVICFKDFLSMMTESEISSKEVDEAFKLFDEDGDGLITAADIHRILTCLGENPTKAMVDKLISEADSDGDGCVNYEGEPVCCYLLSIYYMAM